MFNYLLTMLPFRWVWLLLTSMVLSFVLNLAFGGRWSSLAPILVILYDLTIGLKRRSPLLGPPR